MADIKKFLILIAPPGLMIAFSAREPYWYYRAGWAGRCCRIGTGTEGDWLLMLIGAGFLGSLVLGIVHLSTCARTRSFWHTVVTALFFASGPFWFPAIVEPNVHGFSAPLLLLYVATTLISGIYWIVVAARKIPPDDQAERR